MPVKGLKPIDGVWLSAEEFQERCFARLLTLKGEPGGKKEMIRLSTPRAKKLSEEIMPIAAYARFHQDEELDIRWLGGNQGYDAEVQSPNPRLPQHLEVTIAVPDNEHLVREYHAEHGHSWAVAGTRRSPTTGKVESSPVAEDTMEKFRGLERLVRLAVTKKLAKNYPVSTSLIVQLRLDGCLLRDEFDDIVQNLRSMEVDPAKKFREVLVVEPYEYRAAAL
jgi:hypothetical protein